MPLRTTALVLALCAPSIAVAQSEREVAARVHEAGGYADRLPIEGAASGGSPAGTGAGSGGGGGGGGGGAPSVAAPVAAGATGVSYAVMIAAVIVFVVLIVAVLARLRPRGDATLQPAQARARGLASEAPPLDPIDADPDALAEAGRFEEAIAAALLRGLRAVGWKPEGIGRSRTAREILASVAADDGTLERLVAIEERVLFGGDDATRDRWLEARALWIALGARAR